MPAFQYIALNSQGKEVKGISEADSARQLRQILRDQELTPMEVEPTNKQFDKGDNRSVFSLFAPKLKALDRVLFTRQLSTLLASSMPIEESLNAIAQQNEKQSNKALIIGGEKSSLRG
ncbi:MAG: hypothetical protein ACJ0Q3_10855 [Candidatus Azotimanducaceae bacterium]